MHAFALDFHSRFGQHFVACWTHFVVAGVGWNAVFVGVIVSIVDKSKSTYGLRESAKSFCSFTSPSIGFPHPKQLKHATQKCFPSTIRALLVISDRQTEHVGLPTHFSCARPFSTAARKALRCCIRAQRATKDDTRWREAGSHQ